MIIGGVTEIQETNKKFRDTSSSLAFFVSFFGNEKKKEMLSKRTFIFTSESN